MGAQQFQVFQAGTNTREAFQAAREHALYEYGHRGYTGSLAEKDEFVELHPPAGVPPEQYVRWLMEGCDRVQVDVTEEIQKVPEKERRFFNGTVQYDLVRGDRYFRTERREIPAKHRSQVERDAERIDDKWGPAGCIAGEHKGVKGYWFFGSASS